ncbi:hypothetical protein HHI36_023687 [Cryptolaemus montrouzieri]|uniref:SCA7 domain-containing protein n=1 Tax=Cryptolaemus montrouzieri TaxID=559131 RepID=A0ABD2PHM3_9CUCU
MIFWKLKILTLGAIMVAKSANKISCKECQHVFNPKDILLHKNCSLKVKAQHTSHFKKKVKAKKKSPLPLPPLFPTGLEGVSPLDELSTTGLHPNSMFIVSAHELPPIDADVSPMLPKLSPLVENVEDIPLPSTLSSPMALDESPTSDKTTFITSLDKASSTTSSHTNTNSHLGSKSKKKKYSKSHTESDSNTQCGVVEDPKGPCTRSIKYSNHSSENDPFHQNNKGLSIDNYFPQTNSKEIPVSLPVVYLPMSPVSTVTPLQIIQEGNLVCLETPQVLTPSECPRQLYFTIPEQLNVKMYKTRPKLGSLPMYGARKIGGAIVISKQELVNRRKDILTAINAKHKPNDILSGYKSISLLNNSHRLNILKTKNNKLNIKKPEKNMGNDVKHIRLSSDMNGFIIHNESNEDQQNSIHDGKLSLMNIK